MTAVSVVMPVRDGERFIAVAIKSVLAQSLADFELIVVLDHPTDRSGAIARSLAADDRRILVADNRGDGLVAALNTGIAVSTGEFVARLDADDRMRNGRLRMQRDRLLAGVDISLIGSAAIVIDERGQEIGRIRVPSADPDIRRYLPRGNPFVHSAVMMRRSAVAGVGGYRDSYPHNEDYDLWLRLAGRGRLANLAEPLVDHRRHGGGVSDRFAEHQRHQRRVCFLDWEFTQGLVSDDERARLRGLLDRFLERTSILSVDPSAWRNDDGDSFAQILFRLGGADSRRLSRLLLSVLRAGRVSPVAAARLIAGARIISRFGYRRVVKAAAERLLVARNAGVNPVND